METQGTGSVREGSLEEMACEPSWGRGDAKAFSSEGIPGRRSHTEAGVAVGMCWV